MPLYTLEWSETSLPTEEQTDVALREAESRMTVLTAELQTQGSEIN